MKQGWVFQGRDETEIPPNKGNFLELLDIFTEFSEDAKIVILKNALEKIKSIVNTTATETVNAIIADIGTRFFSILVDEAQDIS